MTSTPPIGTKFFTWFSPSRIGNDGRPDWFSLFSQSPRTPFCEPTVQRHAATRLHQPPIQGRSTHKLTAPIIFEDGILTKDEAIAFTKVGKKTFEDLYGPLGYQSGQNKLFTKKELLLRFYVIKDQAKEIRQ